MKNKSLFVFGTIFLNGILLSTVFANAVYSIIKSESLSSDFSGILLGMIFVIFLRGSPYVALLCMGVNEMRRNRRGLLTFSFSLIIATLGAYSNLCSFLMPLTRYTREYGYVPFHIFLMQIPIVALALFLWERAKK